MRVLWATLALVVTDQLAKVWVRLSMGPHDSIPVVGRLFRLTYTENPGMAFGLTFGSKLFLTLFSIVATVGIGVYLWYVRRAPRAYRLALALVLGGAVGNMIDRTFYGAIWGECEPPGTDRHRLLYGCVVDFVHLDVWQGRLPDWVPLWGGDFFALFPIGNVADLAIIGGVVLILLTQGRAQRALQAQMAPASAEVGGASGEREAHPAPSPPAA